MFYNVLGKLMIIRLKYYYCKLCLFDSPFGFMKLKGIARILALIRVVLFSGARVHNSSCSYCTQQFIFLRHVYQQ